MHSDRAVARHIQDGLPTLHAYPRSCPLVNNSLKVNDESGGRKNNLAGRRWSVGPHPSAIRESPLRLCWSLVYRRPAHLSSPRARLGTSPNATFFCAVVIAGPSTDVFAQGYDSWNPAAYRGTGHALRGNDGWGGGRICDQLSLD